MRIFDIFIYENEKIIFRVALAILKFAEKIILSKVGYAEKFNALKNPKSFLKVSPDTFIERCMKFKFSQKLIEKYHEEYEKIKD